MLDMKYQFGGWKVLERDTKMVWDREGESGREVGSIIIGTYKELLRLYHEQFEYEWRKWKKEYNLDDREWDEVGGSIREMMEMDCIPMEISMFLEMYILSKTPEGRERLESLRGPRDQKREPLTMEELKRYHERARNQNL